MTTIDINGWFNVAKSKIKIMPVITSIRFKSRLAGRAEKKSAAVFLCADRWRPKIRKHIILCHLIMVCTVYYSVSKYFEIFP
jgi:hypothetical protein